VGAIGYPGKGIRGLTLYLLMTAWEVSSSSPHVSFQITSYHRLSFSFDTQSPILMYLCVLLGGESFLCLTIKFSQNNRNPNISPFLSVRAGSAEV
jgi:cytochrome c biogenesis factor